LRHFQVHFSVGDKDHEEDDRKREQAETNTTINLKSWRIFTSGNGSLCHL
ncbi:hypothetical protein ANCCAN_26649, partial [Ancylostoma caninum]